MTATRVGARPAPPAWLAWAALLVIYVVWGSTYLAIRLVVESMPPFLAAAARFGSAGAILFVVLLARSGPDRLRISRGQVAAAAFVGLTLLCIGNGMVSVGEKTVPSGLAALIIGIVPIILLVLRRLAGEALSTVGVVGVVLGFAGLGVLIIPRGIDGTVDPLGVGLLLISATSWAIGSFVSRGLGLPADALVSTCYQLLLGGAMLLVVGLALGESGRVAQGGFTTASVWALLYLIVIGSLLAYSTYTWLLQNVPISRVATYAYVNPVVAVALGALFLGERIDPLMLVGAAMIVTSVAFIVGPGSRPASEPAPRPRSDASGAVAPLDAGAETAPRS